MREAVGRALVELARKGSEFYVVDADNGPATRVRAFGEVFASRYVNVGCAEQNLLGVSAGISLSGVPVVAATFAVFLLGRAFDQIRNTIAASNLQVVLLGTHAGLSTGADGGSHCCPEDLALMRALPGMQIFVPACDEDLERVLEFALSSNGPSYIRVPRVDLWDSQPTTTPIGYFPRAALRCWRTGTEIAFVSAGLMLPRVLAVAEELSLSGRSVAVFDSPCLNLCGSTVVAALREFECVVTVEDHWPAGGIGEMIAAMLAHIPSVTVRGVTAAHRYPSSGQIGEVLDDMGLSEQRIRAVGLEELQLGKLDRLKSGNRISW